MNIEQKPKRILIFSTAYFPFVGGAEVAIKEITDRLDEYEFDLITAKIDKKLPDEERVGNVNVYRLGNGGKLDKIRLASRGALFASKLHKNNTYDATWAVMASFGGFAAMFFKKRHPQVPYVLTLQEGDPIPKIRKKVRLMYSLFKQIFTRANSVTAISNYLADWAKEEGFVGNIDLVPNGVSFSEFSTENFKDSRKQLRQELELEDDDIALITSSRLVKKNGLEDVIKSLTFLRDNIKFLIVGIGELENSLKQTVANLGLESRVLFLGWDGHKRLVQQLHASDIFIRPSLSEGQGISFLEAMAAGLPVIATPVGGIPDFLEHEKTGLFCGVQDPQSIAEQVNRLASDTNLKKTIVSNAAKMVSEQYDWDIIVPQMKEVFERVVK